MIKSGSLDCKRHSRHFLPVLGCLGGRARVAVGFGVGGAGLGFGLGRSLMRHAVIHGARGEEGTGTSNLKIR